MEEIAPRVFRIISRQLGVYPDQIALASSFYDDIGVDSLDVLEVGRLEKRWPLGGRFDSLRRRCGGGRNGRTAGFL